jgi:NADH-quinone oxidoreductase subunit J
MPQSDLAIGGFRGSAPDLGRLLFKEYLLPFEVTSVLILIAIMGAVVLARPRGEE